MTYDYLDVVKPTDLVLALPFPESQPLRSQFRCMLGAQESYLRQLEQGEWQGFSCSLDTLTEVQPAIIVKHMRMADELTTRLLESIDLELPLTNKKYGYEVVQRMVEHEMHHQGQLIHFMFCHHFAVPASWHDKWDL